MKRKFLSTLALTVLTIVSLQAQIKEGYIVYSMKFEGMAPEQAAMMGDMENKVTFKDGKVLTEIATMMGSNTVYIDEKGGMTLLIDQMGNKIAVQQTKEQLAKEAEKLKDKPVDPKIELVNETKTIAGEECKKAIITVIGKDNIEEKKEVWYSDKFENPNKEGKGQGMGFLKGFKGMPFEYKTVYGPFKAQMVATKVSKEPVSSDVFKVSTEGYKVITMEELKGMMGGAGK